MSYFGARYFGAWGKSWGGSWGDSWGGGVQPEETLRPFPWWLLACYQPHHAQANGEVLDLFIDIYPGEAAGNATTRRQVVPISAIIIPGTATGDAIAPGDIFGMNATPIARR